MRLSQERAPDRALRDGVRTWRAATIAFAALIFAAGIVGIVVQMSVPPTDHQTRLAQVLYLLNPVVTSVLGGYLAVVRPRHPAGWLALLIATAGTLDSLAKGTVSVGAGSPDGLQSWAAWLDNWVWVFLFGGIAFLILYFPTGRLPSPRWHPVAVAMGVIVGGEAIACALVHDSVDYPKLHTIAPDVVPEVYANVGFLGLLGCLVAALVSLFVRRRAFRRAGDIVGMAQLRWLLWAAAIALIVLALGIGVDRIAAPTSLLAALWDVLSQIAFFGFPAAIGIAITRHGLFEIDRVVSRSVSYLVITGLLLSTYIGLIAGLSAFLPTNVNSLVVAAATLAVAALFVPVRRAVQQRVDRRFNRSKFNRVALVDQFAESLRRDVTHGSDGADLLAVVHRALEPTHAGLWLVRS